MVHILYTKIPAAYHAGVYDHYLRLLPPDLQEKNRRYRRMEDRMLHLSGQLLLIAGLRKWGLSHQLLHQMNYTMHGRPYINELAHPQLDFNISHSGKHTVCAIGKGVKVGVDVEAIQPVDLQEFRNVMTEQQWQIIESAEDPHQQFFAYWAIKESVMKADGRGMSMDLQGISIEGATALYEQDVWHLHELDIDGSVAACLAVDSGDISYYTEDIDLEYL